VTRHAEILEIEGLFTQGSRPGRTVSERESVIGILEMHSSDWSNGIRYHVIDTRPDTEFKHLLWAARHASTFQIVVSTLGLIFVQSQNRISLSRQVDACCGFNDQHWLRLS